MWLKLKGDIFDFKNDLYVCVAYIIPENTSSQSFTEYYVFRLHS